MRARVRMRIFIRLRSKLTNNLSRASFPNGPNTDEQTTSAMAVSPPDLKDLMNLPVASEWRQLGLQLGVPAHKLNEIQLKHGNSPNFAQDCLRDMFDWWLNNDHNTNYERLAHGIRDIEKIRLVTRFLQQHSHGEVVYLRLANALKRITEIHLAEQFPKGDVIGVVTVATSLGLDVLFHLYSGSIFCLGLTQ